MKYLLDTHTFLWKIAAPAKIPETVFKATKDPDNEIFISAVSLWEIAIKTKKGKLDLGGISSSDLIGLGERMGIGTIELLPQEAAAYSDLTENTLFDPFDRMLIRQAISRKMTLVSGDSEFKRFRKDGLKLLWK